MTTKKPKLIAPPKAGAKKFSVSVIPTKIALDKSISANGACEPKNCWHKVAISSLMEKLEPKANHHVRVDAGHIKLNYRGYRYIADTPLHVKRSILLFDLERYEQLQCRLYTLNFRRTTRIMPVDRTRQDQVNEARRARIAAGGDEAKRSYPNMRKRVAGFSGIV